MRACPSRVGALALLAASPSSALFLPAAPFPAAAASLYSSALVTNPLEIKAATAAVLSVTSDALVQRKETPGAYDVRRAASFATFNAAYKGMFLHFSLPAIFAACQGNVLRHVIEPLPLVVCSDAVLKALERTIANQLVVVPLVFFPLFFAVTGAVQGLSLQASWERMREKYLPMCWNSLRFWFPIQIIQFLVLPLKWQASSVQAISFIWNMILSSLVGSCHDDSCALPMLSADEQ